MCIKFNILFTINIFRVIFNHFSMIIGAIVNKITRRLKRWQHRSCPARSVLLMVNG